MTRRHTNSNRRHGDGRVEPHRLSVEQKVITPAPWKLCKPFQCGDSMCKALRVSPDTCSIISNLIKEENREVWGLEPYDLEDAGSQCKGLERKGIVRVADIKFPFPYMPKSFPLVIVFNALDYLPPRRLFQIWQECQLKA